MTIGKFPGTKGVVVGSLAFLRQGLTIREACAYVGNISRGTMYKFAFLSLLTAIIWLGIPWGIMYNGALQAGGQGCEIDPSRGIRGAFMLP
jgi:hypothetical protein